MPGCLVHPSPACREVSGVCANCWGVVQYPGSDYVTREVSACLKVLAQVRVEEDTESFQIRGKPVPVH